MIAALGVNYMLVYDKRRMSLMMIADILAIAVIRESYRIVEYTILDEVLLAFYAAYAVLIAAGDFVIWRLIKRGAYD